MDEIPHSKKVEARHFKSAITVLVDTILFQRVFGKVKSEDVEEDYYKVLYVRVNDKTLNNAVAQRIEHIYSMIKGPANPSKSEKETPPVKIDVIITFHTKRVSKGFFGSAETIDPECFEKWTLPCIITQIDFTDRERKREEVREQLEAIRLEILNVANANLESLPPITEQALEQGLTPYAFKIGVEKADNANAPVSSFLGSFFSSRSILEDPINITTDAKS